MYQKEDVIGFGAVLHEIIERLHNIDPVQCVPPDEEPGPNDHVVAIATPEIKRLYTLRDLIENEGVQIVDKCAGAPSDEQRKCLLKLGRMYKTVNEALWGEVELVIPDFALKTNGIRKDWQLCWSEKEEPACDIEMHVLRIPLPPELAAMLEQASRH